jgi:hypothetical protein
VPPHLPQLKMKRNSTCLPVGRPPETWRALLHRRPPGKAAAVPAGGKVRPPPRCSSLLNGGCQRLLRHVSKLAALPGRPGAGRAVDGDGEWLGVSVDGEGSALQHEPEVADSQETRQELPVQSRILDLGLF